MLDVSTFHGIIPPLATPLRADESVDEPALRRLVRHVLDGGVHGIFAAGSTGEFAALADAARARAVEIVIEETAGRVPVLVGIGDASTLRAQAWARHAEAAGADAVVAILPYYYATSTVPEVVAHFERLVESSGLPLILYNIPSRTKSALPLAAVEQLRKNDRIVGIKDSAEELNVFYRLLEMRAPGFRVFQGSEMQCGASVLLGADGAVLGISNLAPRLAVRLYEAAAAGDLARTRELQAVVADLNKIYWLAGSSQAGSLKYALSYVGICEPTVTAPLAPAGAEAQGHIRALVDRHRAEL